MKTSIKFFIICVACLFILSCKESGSYPKVLETADSLCNNSPSLAIPFLDSLRKEAVGYAEKDRRYCELLYVKAWSKAHRKMQSDSLISSLVEYYEGGGDIKLLPQAYYYAGRTYRLMGDIPQALAYFQKAKEIADVKTEPELVQVIYSQLGILYRECRLIDYAKAELNNLKDIDQKLEDSVSLIYDWCELGMVYQQNKEIDSCLICYEKALEMAQARKDTTVIAKIAEPMAEWHSRWGDLNKAAEYLEFASKYNKKVDNNDAYIVTSSDLYLKLRDYKKAKPFILKLLSSERTLLRYAGYRDAMEWAILRKDTPEIVRMSLSANYLYDTLKRQSAVDEVAKASAMYNYNLKEKQVEKLRMDRAAEKTTFFLLSLVLAMLAALIVLMLRYRNKKLALEIEKIERIMEEEEGTLLDKMKMRRQIVLDRKKTMLDLNPNDSLREEIASDEGRLDAINQLIRQRQEEQRQRWKVVSEAPAYLSLQNAIRDCRAIKEEEWENINRLVDAVFPVFRQNIESRCPLSKTELQVVYLVALNIKPSEIGTLANRSKQNVSSMRARLFQKMTKRKGKPEDCDRIIKACLYDV